MCFTLGDLKKKKKITGNLLNVYKTLVLYFMIHDLSLSKPGANCSRVQTLKLSHRERMPNHQPILS